MRRFVRITTFAAVALATLCGSLVLGVPRVMAGDGHQNLHPEKYVPNCRPQVYGQPDLFYNYYVPGTCGGVPSQMYVSPIPVPPHVGLTYYTYQPMMPDQLLYPHHRTYYHYYNGGRGLNRTSVHWYRPPVVTLGKGLKSHFELAR